MVIELMSKDNMHEILEFEITNRTFFESVLPPRPEGYYDNFSEFISGLISEQDKGDGYFHIIRDGSGQMIGRINVHTIKDHSAELGYRIGKDFQGKGYATMAVKRMIEICKTEYHLQSLHAGTGSKNIGSQKVLEKNGFVIIGKEKKVMKVNDEWIDGILYNKEIK